MDKVFSPIKERIFKYIKSQSITKEAFYKKANISPSNFKGAGARSEIGGDKITRILFEYPDINPEWLLTGNGVMLKPLYDNNYVSEPQARYNENLLETQRELITMQKDKINNMQQQISELQQKISVLLQQMEESVNR